MTRIRNRVEADLSACVEALRTVYQASGYPANWPADPAQWLQPTRTFQAWVAATDYTPVAGHLALRQPPTAGRSAEVSRLFVVPAARRQGVTSAMLEAAMRAAAEDDLDLFLDVTDRLRAARALYEHTGFRLVSTIQKDWTAPDGRPVTLHRHVWSHSNHDQRRNLKRESRVCSRASGAAAGHVRTPWSFIGAAQQLQGNGSRPDLSALKLHRRPESSRGSCSRDRAELPA